MNNHTMRKVKPKEWGKEMGVPMKNEKMYPSFSVNLSDFPAAAEWRVGNEYMITIRVRQSELEQRKEGKGRASFEILEIGGEPYKKPKSKRYERQTR